MENNTFQYGENTYITKNTNGDETVTGTKVVTETPGEGNVTDQIPGEGNGEVEGQITDQTPVEGQTLDPNLTPPPDTDQSIGTGEPIGEGGSRKSHKRKGGKRKTSKNAKKVKGGALSYSEVKIGGKKSKCKKSKGVRGCSAKKGKHAKKTK